MGDPLPPSHLALYPWGPGALRLDSHQSHREGTLQVAKEFPVSGGLSHLLEVALRERAYFTVKELRLREVKQLVCSPHREQVAESGFEPTSAVSLRTLSPWSPWPLVAGEQMRP